jgi:uncharacterized protein (UPF0335 family)
MDDETRTAFATMAESMAAGFAGMDRYFELQQAQHIEFRTEVNGRLDALTERVDRLEAEVAVLRQEVAALRQDVDSLRQDVDALRREFRAFRDWTTREVSELRRDVRASGDLTKESETEVRRDLDQLTNRVDRVEERLGDLCR